MGTGRHLKTGGISRLFNFIKKIFCNHHDTWDFPIGMEKMYKKCLTYTYCWDCGKTVNVSSKDNPLVKNEEITHAIFNTFGRL